MAERQRIEDLGILSERLNSICESIKDLNILIEEIPSTPDLELISHRLTTISFEISDAWCLARFGDDEDGVESIYPDIELDGEFDGKN